jgi:predicted Rossmann fold flavoprotein
MQSFDVVVVGAGAAGLFCAAVAGQAGLQVLLLEHSERVGEKIRISGGGRCNFSNREVLPANFLSANPHFCRSALSRYTPADFIALLERHHIAYHEKHKGQLFCDRSAQDIISMLMTECGAGQVEIRNPCRVQAIRSIEGDAHRRYELDTDAGTVCAGSVVIATGGLSIPKIGASDFGYRIARQFGLRLVETRPALVPLTFEGSAWQPYAELAGLSLKVAVACGEGKQGGEFLEDLLFTHRGLSGPAVLQISSYWREGMPLRLDLAPGHDLRQALAQAKAGSRKRLVNELTGLLPGRLAQAWVLQDAAWQRPLNETPDKALDALCARLARWEIVPSGSEGYAKAEVTLGGIDTRDLSSQTMESRQAGLYFIGEVVDVTGWLGGYNFQWAWASAHACAQALAAQRAVG